MDDRTHKTIAEQIADEQAKKADEADFTTPMDDVPPEQLDEESNFEHTLSRPIEAHGERLGKLTWREPTGGDIERAGVPITMDFFGEKPSLTFNEKKMSAMISTLCQIPPSAVRQLTAGDWNAIAWKLVRFFMPRTVG
jgi:hypothetical protein